MGQMVECPRCSNRFRIHSRGQRDADCYECGNRFNGITNPALDRDLDDPVGGGGY